MAYSAVSDYYERERNAWIDDYLLEHPDATEFEAALAYEVEPLPPPFITYPKAYDHANI